MSISISLEDSVLVLKLASEKGNAINAAFIEAMHGALDEAERSPARAIVVTGRGRAFCGGLDVGFTGGLDRDAMARFVDAFEAMFTRFFTFPKPIVAAINGFAVAGGCILALAADVRVLARGAHSMGTNEVVLGIPLPAAAFEIARYGMPRSTVAAAFLEGRLFSPDEALAAGLVDSLVDEAALLPSALEAARRLSIGSRDAVATVKADLRSLAVERMHATSAARKARFLDAWFSVEARARFNAVREKLAKPAPAS